MRLALPLMVDTRAVDVARYVEFVTEKRHYYFGGFQRRYWTPCALKTVLVHANLIMYFLHRLVNNCPPRGKLLVIIMFSLMQNVCVKLL